MVTSCAYFWMKAKIQTIRIYTRTWVGKGKDKYVIKSKWWIFKGDYSIRLQSRNFFPHFVIKMNPLKIFLLVIYVIYHTTISLTMPYSIILFQIQSYLKFRHSISRTYMHDSFCFPLSLYTSKKNKVNEVLEKLADTWMDHFATKVTWSRGKFIWS